METTGGEGAKSSRPPVVPGPPYSSAPRGPCGGNGHSARHAAHAAHRWYPGHGDGGRRWRRRPGAGGLGAVPARRRPGEGAAGSAPRRRPVRAPSAHCRPLRCFPGRGAGPGRSVYCRTVVRLNVSTHFPIWEP